MHFSTIQFVAFFFPQRKKKYYSACVPRGWGTLTGPMIIKTTLKLIILLISYTALLSS